MIKTLFVLWFLDGIWMSVYFPYKGVESVAFILGDKRKAQTLAKSHLSWLRNVLYNSGRRSLENHITGKSCHVQH